MKDVIQKLVAAQRCHPNAVQTLIEEAIELLHAGKPVAQRITEQDAREIIDAFCLFATDKTLPLHLMHWLESCYCNTLLAKLNENRGPVAHDRTEVLGAIEALKLYERAFDSIFSQCLSNGMQDAWGKPVDCTLLNEAHCAAQNALNGK